MIKQHDSYCDFYETADRDKLLQEGSEVYQARQSVHQLVKSTQTGSKNQFTKGGCTVDGVCESLLILSQYKVLTLKSTTEEENEVMREAIKRYQALNANPDNHLKAQRLVLTLANGQQEEFNLSSSPTLKP